MMRQFLNKYFPDSRAINIWREICGIKQKPTETLYEYWERFKRLCASYPQHGVFEQSLIHYFYEGLLPTERGMLEAASNGCIVDKTPAEARELISTMAATSQEFRFRQGMPRTVNETSISSIEAKLNQLTNMVHNMATWQIVQVKLCGICVMQGHPTDMCSKLQEHTQGGVNAICGFQHPQKRYDPYFNTYNPGWRDHPNFSYAPRPQGYTGQGKLPSQTKTNPKHNANAITLRSGKELEDIPAKLRRGHTLETKIGTKPEAELEVSKQHDHQQKEEKKFPPAELIAHLPFLERFAKSRKEREEKEIMDTFRRVEVNIPPLGPIKQIPRCAKFLKELCTNKKKLTDNDK
ncbi:uncharacterized protein G2W53_015264 [Senna tora]|uniref:Retrotransposon gag domain-containing protein n=1 Tax=Senna tora TaxID=362788 RepID=A0A835C490_9FABA|nr:uncharacterized protein G2W53_015264 [Senna tora]